MVSPSTHEKLKIAEASNRQEFINHLNLHSQCKRSHLEMSRGLADSGIEKWTFDTDKMTINYYDMGGTVMMVEKIG